MTGAKDFALKELSLSEEELRSIELLENNWWMLWIVAPHFQIAVESLVPEFYNQNGNDSLWHWWRRIWEYLGETQGIDRETFWKEFREDRTTLTYSNALKVWKATKNYLLQILENGKKWEEIPSWWSQLQAIYDPPLHEISQIVTWNRD
jgi:hypothetical protein